MGRLRRVDFPWHKRESQRLEAQPSRAGLEPASRATRFTGGGDSIFFRRHACESAEAAVEAPDRIKTAGVGDGADGI